MAPRAVGVGCPNTRPSREQMCPLQLGPPYDTESTAKIKRRDVLDLSALGDDCGCFHPISLVFP